MSDMTVGIAGGALLAAILVSISFAYWRRRVRTKRQMVELLRKYFQGDTSADQVGQLARAIASRHFIGSAGFFSLVVAAFQSAADAKLGQHAHSQEEESKLLRLLADLKNEFGLTDRYRIEAWRPGRE